MDTPTVEPNPESVLYTQDVARRLNVARETVWRWTQSGLLPAPDIKIGRRVGWRLATIRAFERAQAPATSQAA